MYQTEHEGTHHELGTSGFLYRSNKLMYDHETESLWSTLQGEPVVGTLVGKGIKLNRRHVVTTTWENWKARHPDTKVLSLETGHQRDYSEGAAYRRYFSTDRLMFQVPKTDDRLANKTEVFALRSGEDQLAIAIDFLKSNTVYHDKINDQELVIFADGTGASRAYESQGITFKEFNGVNSATDSAGNHWVVTEDKIELNNKTLRRIPSHRSFWFGWQSQFPNTRLVR